MEADNSVSKPRMRIPRSLIIQLVLLVVFVLLPLKVTSPYHLSLLITVGMYAILAMTFIMLLRNDLITLGIAAFWGIGAYSSTMLVLKAGVSFWVALPAAAIITGIFALIFGLFVIRNPGFSFIIITMVIGLLFVVVVGSTQWLGGYTGIVSIPPPTPINIPFLPPIEFTSSIAQYYLMIFLFVVSMLIISAFYSSSIGRAWTAIGLNSQLAASIGVSVYRYRLLAFVVSCTIVGMVGSYYAHFIGCLHPDTFNMFKTIYIHLYAILGGVGFPFLGPSVGSGIMVLFPEFMRITREIEPIITGLLLIVLMIFLPTGVLSLPGVRTFAKDPVGSVSRLPAWIKSLPARRGTRKP